MHDRNNTALKEETLKIRLHGRGGQGVVIASAIIGYAASVEGKGIVAFPKFGVERRGAPLEAYCYLRFDGETPIERYEIKEPDCLIVLDEALIDAPGLNIFVGLKKGGWVIINSPKTPKEFAHIGPYKVATVPASKIAGECGIGTKINPIVNTTIIGAAIRVLQIITIESFAKAVEQKFGKKAAKSNVQAARDAFEQTILGDKRWI